MSIEGYGMSNAGGSGAMSVDNSSVGSNDSHAHILNQQGNHIHNNYSVAASVVRGRVSRWSDDALAQALVDPQFPTIKLLERPEYDLAKVMILANLKHPNIVRFIGACRKAMVWCILTEYARGGSVRQFLTRRQNQAVPLKLVVKQVLNVARGMEHMHGLNLIHRDLKSDNLLIAADKSIKIADFGIARIEVLTEGMTPETGTYRWMAPEMIQHRPYTQKVDVYSFGIVLWELITGLLPYQSMTAVQAAFAVVNKGVRPTIPIDCLPVLSDIMTCCWDSDPDNRPTFSQVVKMLEAAETEIMTNIRRARFRCSPHPTATG